MVLKLNLFSVFNNKKNIKYDLLITVDNGIVADKEFAKIKPNSQLE
jgi:single-stranded DNA-specific DHH superfamily exonuclease